MTDVQILNGSMLFSWGASLFWGWRSALLGLERFDLKAKLCG